MHFGNPKMRLINKYNGPCMHLSRWVKAYGKQRVRMHMDFALGNTVNKHVLGGKWHERSLKVEQQNVERTSVQKVTHAEAFNEVCEALNRVYNAQRSDWDLRVPAVLWAYRMACKKLTGKTTFRLVYVVEAIMPMEYIMPTLRIAVLIGMTDRRALEERLSQLEELEEE